MKKHLPISKLNLLFLVLLISSTNLWAVAPPTIASFSPTSGPVGTTVTISGTNFNTTAANNIVFFGATRAAVSAANSTSLTVIVPKGATYQSVSVSDITTGLTGYSAMPFVTTFGGGGTIDAISFAGNVDYATGYSPGHVSISDLDGDGKLDVIVANYSSASNSISIFRNTSLGGTVSFAPKVDYNTGSAPNNIVSGDMDGDGKPDIAVVNYLSNTVSVFRNNCTSGTISFLVGSDCVTGSYPNNIAMGDLDGDGKPELIVVNVSSYSVSVFRNTSTSGATSFASKSDFSTHPSPKGISIADLDGDGKLDLIVGSTSFPSISVYKNTTISNTISFDSYVDFTTGSHPQSISTGDFDGDGKPDLAVANYNPNTISILKNTSTSGAVSFATKIDYSTGASPNYISTGDLDGDGKPDLAVANLFDNTISVYKNLSTSGTVLFAAKVDYTTGVNPYSISMGDIDGDDKPDIILPNSNSNTFSILRNTIGEPRIFTFSPMGAPTGSAVTITGLNFTNTTAVSFGGTPALFYSVISSTTIIATVGSGTTGNVTVKTTYGTAAAAGFTFKLLQNINFTPIAAQTYGSADFSPIANASSTLPITYSSSNTAVATIVSNKVHLVGPGNTTIYADQPGNGTYMSAPQVSKPLTVNTKALTITGVTASNKAYDGTTASSLSGGALTGIVGSDVVTITMGTGVFSDKNVGNSKTVTASGYSLGGTNVGKYILSAQPTGITANITPVSLTITGVLTGNKVYNGNITASLSGGTLNGILGTEVVTLTAGSGVFSDKNVGNGKAITASGYTIAGADAGNYALASQPSGITANITPAFLSINGVSANNKTYNNTTTATLTGGTLTGIIGSDAVTITAGIGTFVDKNVGNGKAVTVIGYAIAGAGAVNYLLTGQPTGITANVTAAPLTITGVTANNKVYDGLTSVTLNGGILNGIAGSDVITMTAGTGIFSDKNVGIGKTIITSGYAIAGAGAGNYSLAAQPSGITANLTSAPITITGVTASDKVYNGAASATLSNGTLNGVLGSDIVTITAGTGVFSNKNVGNAKTVTASGYTIAGAGAGNYTLASQPSGITANITPASVGITGITANNKMYNGTTTASFTGGTLTGIIGADVVTISAGTGTFADKNVGNGKTVTVSGFTIVGADAANYVLSAQPSGFSANITPASLTITGVTASNKVYDGSSSTTLTGGTLSGIIGQDVVNLISGTGVFADKNVGNGKTIIASGYSIGGASMDNYALVGQPYGIIANITPASLSITGITANNKVYDGTTASTLAGGTLTGILNPDIVILNPGAGVFGDKNVGITKTINVSGYSIGGANAGNYILSAQPSGLIADIIAKPITITVNAGQSKKTGAADPNFTYSISNGALVAGETLTGALTRLSGESAVSYPIQIGTLTAGTNYNTSFITDNFTIMSGTGVVSILAEKPSVYPNPTNGLVSLDIQGGLMSVFDLNGKMVLEQTLGNNKTFDIGYLASGTYILILKTKDSTYNYKIVKQ